MEILLIWFAAAVAVPQTHVRVVPGPSDPVLVRAVVDAVTIDVQGAGRVRLLGIAAPAPSRGRGSVPSTSLAAQAKARLTTLLLNRWVRLDRDDRSATTRQAYVTTGDGQFVNAVLVREGLARVAARAGLARLDELERAEREAQEFHRGVWARP
jgi:endonuclease YncB( thermonuclease family)